MTDQTPTREQVLTSLHAQCDGRIEEARVNLRASAIAISNLAHYAEPHGRSADAHVLKLQDALCHELDGIVRRIQDAVTETAGRYIVASRQPDATQEQANLRTLLSPLQVWVAIIGDSSSTLATRAQLFLDEKDAIAYLNEEDDADHQWRCDDENGRPALEFAEERDTLGQLTGRMVASAHSSVYTYYADEVTR